MTLGVRPRRRAGLPLGLRRPRARRRQRRPGGAGPGHPHQPGAADAAATNAFLVGGLEPAGQRADYDDAIDRRLRADRRGRAAPSRPTAPRSAPLNADAGRATPAASSRPGPTTGRACRSGRSTSPSASAGLRADARCRCSTTIVARQQRPRRSRSSTRAEPALLVAGAARPARPRRARRRAGLAGPAHPPLRQPPAGRSDPRRRWSALVAGWVGPGRRRPARVDEVRDGAYAAALATAQARIAGVRRQGQREPDADRPRVRRQRSRRPGSSCVRQVTRAQRRGQATSAGADLRWAAYARAHQALRALDDGGQLGAGGRRRDGTGRHRARPARPDRSAAFDTASRDLLAATSGEAAAAARRTRRLARPRRRARAAARAAGRRGVLVGRLPAAGGVPVSRRLPAAWPARSALVVLATVAGCGVRRLRAHPGRQAAPAAAAPTANPGTATPAPAATGAAVTAANCLQSYAPQGALPAPGALPAGSTMERIRKRGYLIAGVSADTLLLGARNPVTGRSRASTSTCCTPSRRRSSATRTRSSCGSSPPPTAIPLLQDGSVDIVARNMTITCDRWKRDRLHLGVLPRRPEGPRPARVATATSAGRPEGQAGLRAHRVDQPGQAAASTAASIPVARRQPHRLPGAVPAGQGRRHHR